MSARRKTDAEYTDVLTTVRIERGTDRNLKTTVEKLNISQSVFIRQAIKDAITAAGVVE